MAASPFPGIGPASPAPLQAAAGREESRATRLKEVAEGFEAIFLRQLLKTMRATVPGGMYGSGVSGEIYGDIVDYALASAMSERGALGLADLIIDRYGVADSEQPAAPEPRMPSSSAGNMSIGRANGE